MGTRSLTVLHENDEWGGGEIAVLYRQMDGYPSGHGQELRDFLKDIHMTNGIGMYDGRQIANGGSCLAAQIVAHFKTDVGGFYLHPAGSRGHDEEYIYHVHPSIENGNIRVEIEIPPDFNSLARINEVDKFGRVWYNRENREKSKKGENMDNQYHVLRYSASKGKWVTAGEMHPCHVLNALRIELDKKDAQTAIDDPLVREMCERVATAEKG